MGVNLALNMEGGGLVEERQVLGDTVGGKRSAVRGEEVREEDLGSQWFSDNQHRPPWFQHCQLCTALIAKGTAVRIYPSSLHSCSTAPHKTLTFNGVCAICWNQPPPSYLRPFRSCWSL